MKLTFCLFKIDLIPFKQMFQPFPFFKPCKPQLGNHKRPTSHFTYIAVNLQTIPLCPQLGFLITPSNVLSM